MTTCNERGIVVILSIAVGQHYGAWSFASRASNSTQLDAVVANFRCFREIMCCIHVSGKSEPDKGGVQLTSSKSSYLSWQFSQ